MTDQWKPATGSAWAGFRPLAPGQHSADDKPACPCQEVLLTRIRRRDWEQILGELTRKGVPMRDVARQVGLALSTVQNWTLRGEPKESDARKVLALYRRHVGPI